MTWPRIASSRAKTTKAAMTMTVSITSVSVLRLDRTRSNNCSM